jgi:hypothetical protein
MVPARGQQMRRHATRDRAHDLLLDMSASGTPWM